MKNKTENNSMDRIERFLLLAKSKGLDQSYLFTTTLERYRLQLSLLESMKEALKEDETTITKEYVKGRENLYVNPLIQRINQTIDSANKTASFLYKMIGSESTATEDDLEDLFFMDDREIIRKYGNADPEKLNGIQISKMAESIRSKKEKEGEFML